MTRLIELKMLQTLLKGKLKDKVMPSQKWKKVELINKKLPTTLQQKLNKLDWKPKKWNWKLRISKLKLQQQKLPQLREMQEWEHSKKRSQPNLIKTKPILTFWYLREKQPKPTWQLLLKPRKLSVLNQP